MLSYLKIDNYALIEREELEFSPGFNVVTGESGAGKSILMGALEFLIGGRTDRGALRSGCSRCTVSGIFTLSTETAERVAGLEREGLARPWERDQAALLAETREAELGAARRRLAVVRGDLMQALGLSPLADFSLAPPPEADESPLEPLEDLVLCALETNPQLPIADREVVMKENAVRRAFCAFLPNLSAFGQWSFTGNKVMNPPDRNFDWGFRGTWDLFTGFRSVADVRAAKAERRKAELSRENTFLSVMAGVVSARAAVEDAAAGAAVRRRAWEVAAGRAEDLMARAKEGLEPVSDALDAEAARDLAEAEYLRAAFTERVARENLDFAVGKCRGKSEE